MASDPTTRERLELHNQAMLIKRARDKMSAGKPLTNQEIEAVDRAERSKQVEQRSRGELFEDVQRRYLIAYQCMRGNLCPSQMEIEAMLGVASVSTLKEVAATFGLSPHTINQSWRNAGMPGSNGKYQLAEILAWRLSYERDNEKFIRPENDATARLRELEIEKKELENERLRAEFMAGQGQMCEIGKTQAEVWSFVTTLKEAILGLPRSMAPMYPAKDATRYTAELEKQIRHILNAIANGRIARQKIADMAERIDKSLTASTNGKK